MSTLTVGTIAEKVTDAGVAVDGVTLKDGTVTANRLSSDGTIIDLQKDGTSIGNIGVANTDQLSIGTPDGSEMGLRFDGDLQHILPANATGAKKDASADLGSSTARWQNLYLSGGIYLGGTGSANLLSDYEEGTWTPSLEAYGGTPTFLDAFYTKIGRYVFATCRVALDGTSDASVFRINGLPFSSLASTAAIFGANVIYANSSTAPTYGLVVGSSNYANFYNSSGTSITYNGAGNDKSYRINFHYFTT